MNEIELLKQIYGIQSEEQFDEYRKKSIMALTAGKRPSEEKEIIIVGGQSGAGKSRLVPIAKRDLNNGAVVVDFDELRSYHPSYNAANKAYPEIVHQILHPDTNKVKNQTLDYLIQNGYNMIYEGALRDTQGFIDFAEKFKKNDYRIHMYVMAVPELESYGSTFYRYAAALMTDNTPRWVEKAYHDASYEGVVRTVQAFQEQKLADQIDVFVRGGNEPKRIYSTTQQQFRSPEAAIIYGRENGRRKAVQDFPSKYSIVEQILREKRPEALPALEDWKRLYEAELEYFKSLQGRTQTDN